jgi:hypothetical protein
MKNNVESQRTHLLLSFDVMLCICMLAVAAVMLAAMMDGINNGDTSPLVLSRHDSKEAVGTSTASHKRKALGAITNVAQLLSPASHEKMMAKRKV